MFVINEDKSIYCTRGDFGVFSVQAMVGSQAYTFRVDDVVRFKVFSKKNCSDVVLTKDVVVKEEGTAVEIELDGDETKFGEIISKPVDYWYEVELNPETRPQTIIGYDDNGAKVFKLFPEGAEV